ncbi:MAG: hypothetical protein UR99_C0017G0015 [Candidatus Moranbacteria bacterium GW2011_GWD2_36_12]|nr:MAG: hypothetical protein UR99_C0017G0015 [Candidatus Moranbacteria bacterium GW2011_GWD2_36_12]
MNTSLTNGAKFYRCPHCTNLVSENFVGENNKIKCNGIILHKLAYKFCGMTFSAEPYNLFIWNTENERFKKEISAKHWW